MTSKGSRNDGDARKDIGGLLHVGKLPRGRAVEFQIEPDADDRARIAAELGILGIRKLRFTGTLDPAGSSDWLLTGTLGATVTQSCVVSLDPVNTRIDDVVTRTYVAHPPDEPEGGEVEMPEDDTVEPLTDVIDLAAVMVEALSLALPAYPRTEGVALDNVQFAPPGIAPMTDEDTKPFAALKALKEPPENDT